MPERIGDYMTRTGAMTKAQVDAVVKAKDGGDQRHFGEIAIALGFITQAKVDAYLAQK